MGVGQSGRTGARDQILVIDDLMGSSW